ncbi:hypothetical protein BU25DRAFT_352497 [Macroventuria anomochaeta]|uniref:Uncharacterized protein n=1 Tax=Macroventuria anomochaeta TaxID=301207 RepID=A0ACB6RK42_9PLEO|nr:uncharacterized protein BU25DRAFT_352497 [Macroventuria anomochaeta]KAF2622325.1 hypothetical protein BU25DRAFT_352497 [Macroventuria anomochaeta]
MPRTPSPKRIDNSLDRRDKLEAYGINVDRGCDLPAALVEHISTVIEAPRELDAVPSPNAKQLVQRRRNAALQSERNGITQIAPFLGFIGEVEGTPGLALDPLLVTKQDLALHSFFLPSAPNPAVVTTWKALSQPQPDVCTGYVTRRDAETVSLPCAAAFTADEEAILDRYRLSQFLHFPFLTMQYKAANANETLRHAQNQAARDGAVAVNYLYEFYLAAYKRPLSAVDTHHVSVTCDMEHCELWMHWRDGQSHYMELVSSHSMRDYNAMLQLRGQLRNVRDWALGPRLQSIKTALPDFAASQSLGDYPILPTPSTTSQYDSASMSSHPRILPPTLGFAPTPRTIQSEPSKASKRRRYAGDDNSDTRSEAG